MKLLLSILAFASTGFAAEIAWDFEHTQWTRADVQSEWKPAAQFRVYHSRHGSDWQLIGTTSSQTFTITNRGWYAVEAALGTNRSELATCAFNPFTLMRVRTLRIRK